MNKYLSGATRDVFAALIIVIFLSFGVAPLQAQEKTVPAVKHSVYLRVKVLGALPGGFNIIVGGFRHAGEPWYFPEQTIAVSASNSWSEWADLSALPWHERQKRSGGIAEWSTLKLSILRAENNAPLNDCEIEVELAERPAMAAVRFVERSESNTVAFLVPVPLGRNKNEFETGTQMTARHRLWANAAVKNRPVVLKQFEFASSLWGHYDPALARREVETLRILGFNTVSNVDNRILRELKMRTDNQTWLYAPDPAAVAAEWRGYFQNHRTTALTTEDGQWQHLNSSAYVIADEVRTLSFRGIDPARLNGWFQDYLRKQGVTAADLNQPLEQVAYPTEMMFEKSLPQNAPLHTKRLLYHAAKFGQWWSARQLRQTADLIRGSVPGARVETLPTSHGFFNAWGPPTIGMSYGLLDLFQLGEQRSVDRLSVEDWLGLNHMYGPEYTWTGAQSFAYLNAITRSATLRNQNPNQPIGLKALITPSDDDYLQLKAHSSLGQGAKSFFFWNFGPTYISTENYWSDLESEYQGIVKLGRALEKSEEILHPAQPVRDPVAVLYSTSHDIWHNNDPAVFVEKRLLWHALRHLHVQPDFLSEEAVANGKLQEYKVLYLTDWAMSRKTSTAIDEWVKNGGVVYLSAGAATRDEFNEPYLPGFAAQVWTASVSADAEKNIQPSYNERTDLPKAKSLDTATIALPISWKNNFEKSTRFQQVKDVRASQFRLPVIAHRQTLKPQIESFARYGNGESAAAAINYKRGKIVAVGFLPMLAYGQLAKFQPATLAERWTPEPREIIKLALDAGRVAPVADADVPVVETSLLTGAKGSVLVLANYTYQPLKRLTVTVELPHSATVATGTQGEPVQIKQLSNNNDDGSRNGKRRVAITLPLRWTDIVLLPK